MIKALICVCLATFLASQAEGTVIPSWLEAVAKTGNCQFYDMMENLFKCGTLGYFKSYGKKYCTRFGEHSSVFSAEGNKWVDSVRICLMTNLIEIGKSTSNCDEIKTAAFDSHVGCYLNPSDDSPGFCKMIIEGSGVDRPNMAGLFNVFKEDPKDLFSKDSAKQIWGVSKQCSKDVYNVVQDWVVKAYNSAADYTSSIIDKVIDFFTF